MYIYIVICDQCNKMKTTMKSALFMYCLFILIFQQDKNRTFFL